MREEYEELILKLRNAGKESFLYSDLMREAADVIEELSRENESLGNDLISAVEMLKKKRKPKWIPVTERLSEEEGSVLIFSELGGIAEGHYSHMYGVWVQYRWNVKDIKVTHWMPLPPSPEPPEKEKT